MTASTTDPPRLARPAALLRPMVTAGALVLVLFLAPFPTASLWSGGGYSTRAALVRSLSSGFVLFWDGGIGVVSPNLIVPVDFWMRFHVVKAILAAALVVVLARLGSRTWTAYTSATTAARKVAAGMLAAATAVLGMVALLILVANLQGAIAPLSSALGLLPMGTPDPALAGTVSQVRHDLATGVGSPALAVLVHDFSAYHVAMAGIGALTTAGLLATAVFLWRRRRRLTAGRQPGRQLLASVAVAAVAFAAFFAVVTAANLSTSAHPAPALLGFFEGGG